MTPSFRRLWLALAVAGALSPAFAQQASKLVSKEIALEVPAGSIVLPASTGGTAVFAPCGGCVVKSFPTSATTGYYLKLTPVSLVDLKAAIEGKPGLILTVEYSVATGELVRVTADVAAPAPRRTP